MSIISYDNNLGDSKSTGSWRTDDEVMSIYEGWLAEHGKAYNALGEKERRFQIFKDNLRYIDEQNSKNLRDREASETRRRVMEVEIAVRRCRWRLQKKNKKSPRRHAGVIRAGSRLCRF